jgi:hypothetical protein
MPLAPILQLSEPEDIATPDVAASRVGPLGFPAVAYEDDSTQGVLAASLPALTGALTGTFFLSHFGTIAASLPKLTSTTSGTINNPEPRFGPIIGTLPKLTGVLAGISTTNYIGTLDATLPALTGSIAATSVDPTTGTLAGSLQALTGALLGTHTEADAISGHIMASLPALTGALAGTTIGGTLSGTLPALTGVLAGTVNITGTLAGTLPVLTGRLEGSGGQTADVGYPESVYRKKGAAERRRKAERDALNKRIRQKLGLEPPDPEEEVEPLAPDGPLPPFLIGPDLGSVGSRRELALLKEELATLDGERRRVQGNHALAALMLADDSLPGADVPDLEDLMAVTRVNGAGIAAFAKEVQALAQTGEEANGQTQQLVEQFSQMTEQLAQAVAQSTQAQAESAQQSQEILSQIAQAIGALTQSQGQLMEAVKAPRKRTITVNRDPKTNRVLGANSLEEVE